VEDFRRRLNECHSCRLRDGCKAPVPGNGSIKTDVMLIGEAPGRNEDDQGVPFCGDAGKYLDAGLEFVGLHREDVYVTNVVKCRPPGNRDPKPDEIDACKPWLREELLMVRPKIVVTLGRFAAERMLGRKVAIMKDRGKAEAKKLVVNDVVLRVKVFPLLHPAWILRGDRRANMDKYRKDLVKLRQLLEGSGIVAKRP